jgi:spermidine synthase
MGLEGAASLLSLVFFLSGASALVLETLWFRQAGLALGNSIWASSLVLASFMGGLSLGNGLAARHGGTIRRPLRAYALLELVVAITGAGLVLAWPSLGPLLAPWFRGLAGSPVALNLARTGVALALMLVPAAAMGATLPILTRVLGPRSGGFGRTLGWLYGVNTLGAVAGAVAAETLLVGQLGIRGTALTAASMNLCAALTALALSSFEGSEPAPVRTGVSSIVAPRILLAASLCGAALLALEVIWFRFLALFVRSSNLAFALLLTVVLLGIALGGFAASALLGRYPAADRQLRPILLLAAILTLLTYAQFGRIGGLETQSGSVARILVLAGFLTFPVSLLSGISFTLLGHRAHPEGGSESQTAGQLTLANTLGALLGSLAGGFLLLPNVGVEGSVVVLGLAYAAAAALVPAGAPRLSSGALGPATLILFAVSLATFPFGAMQRTYLAAVGHRFGHDGSRVLATREGLTETLIYMRRDEPFEPPTFRLITNGFSMAQTGLAAQRYMSLYALWPAALHPGLHRALLISYGCGTTALALTRVPGLEHLDVIDTSRDILSGSGLMHPHGSNPLADPRVVAHVEDGRHFLLTSAAEYDLITAEPPPPRAAGVVSLYTREYFSLLRRRLAPGGLVTYWLPVGQLMVPDTQAVLGAFCDAFPDCSLWNGAGLNWMLVGTRDFTAAASEGRFAGLWQDPQAGPALSRIGVERPEQLGALFIADATTLREWVARAPSLVDDFPNRILHAVGSVDLGREVLPTYLRWRNADDSRSRFAASRFVAALWPPALRQRSLASFEWEGWLDQGMWEGLAWQPPSTRGLTELDRVITRTPLLTLPLWLLGTNVDEQRTVSVLAEEGKRHEELLGLGALAARDYERAADLFARADLGSGNTCRRAYALALAGRRGEVEALAAGRRSAPDFQAESGFWDWMSARFGYPDRSARRVVGMP